MVELIWSPKEMPTDRHVVVHVHQIGLPTADKGYFFISDEADWGGSGPFDMRIDEAIERAKRIAEERGIRSVIIVRQP